MKKYTILPVISFIFLLLATGCGQREAEKLADDRVLNIPNDSLGYYNARGLDSLIGLKNIASAEGREYRFLFGLNEPVIGYVIVIKEDANIWKGELHRYLITKVDQASGIISSVKALPVIAASPKSGHTSFKDKFESLNIDSFRKSDDIPGYTECMGIGGINIEISDSGSHRRISYACLSENESLIPEIKSLRAVIKYIQDEFRFNLWGGDPLELHVDNKDSLKNLFIELSRVKEK